LPIGIAPFKGAPTFAVLILSLGTGTHICPKVMSTCPPPKFAA
jgi:hypothetical protein